MSSEKNILWTSDIDDEEYLQELRDIYPDTSEDEIWEMAAESNQNILDEIKNSISEIQFRNPIIALGTIGRWCGPVKGYKLLSSNLTDCFQSFVTGDSSLEIFVQDKDLQARESHHDGTNYYRFRVFRDFMTDGQMDKFMDKIYNGTATEKDIAYYTKPVITKSILNRIP